jgi:hypothetical protein
MEFWRFHELSVMYLFNLLSLASLKLWNETLAQAQYGLA